MSEQPHYWLGDPLAVSLIGHPARQARSRLRACKSSDGRSRCATSSLILDAGSEVADHC